MPPPRARRCSAAWAQGSCRQVRSSAAGCLGGVVIAMCGATVLLSALGTMGRLHSLAGWLTSWLATQPVIELRWGAPGAALELRTHLPALPLPFGAGVEAALGAMQRQQEAVLLCPASQLCGGGLVPEPPGAAAPRAGAAAPDYAEVRLQLLDFTQVGGWGSSGGVLRGWCTLRGRSRGCTRHGRSARLQQSLAATGRARPASRRSVMLASVAPPDCSSPCHPPPSPCVQVRDMAGDGQVMKRIVRKGEGEFPIDCPLEDSHVRVHVR